nr:hypothetical protein CVCH_093 [Cavernulicola chilensis]
MFSLSNLNSIYEIATIEKRSSSISVNNKYTVSPKEHTIFGTMGMKHHGSIIQMLDIAIFDLDELTSRSENEIKVNIPRNIYQSIKEKKSTNYSKSLFHKENIKENSQIKKRKILSKFPSNNQRLLLSIFQPISVYALVCNHTNHLAFVRSNQSQYKANSLCESLVSFYQKNFIGSVQRSRKLKNQADLDNTHLTFFFMSKSDAEKFWAKLNPLFKEGLSISEISLAKAYKMTRTAPSDLQYRFIPDFEVVRHLTRYQKTYPNLRISQKIFCDYYGFLGTPLYKLDLASLPRKASLDQRLKPSDISSKVNSVPQEQIADNLFLKVDDKNLFFFSYRDLFSFWHTFKKDAEKYFDIDKKILKNPPVFLTNLEGLISEAENRESNLEMQLFPLNSTYNKSKLVS